MHSALRPVLAAAAALAVLPAAAHAERLTGVDTSGRLVTFDAKTPGKVSARAITGLPGGVRIEGLDRRPANDALVALGSNGQLFTIDPASAAATAVGPGPFTPGLSGNAFGFDFNPAVDRLRLVSDFAQNLRLQPDMGTVAATDGALAFGAGDPNAGKAAAVSGAAYTNSVKGATTTQLFDLDTANDLLVLQDPPNPGGLKTVGGLGVGNVTSPVAFDISGATGTAFASLKLAGKKGTRLYRVDLTSGAAKVVGTIGKRKAPLTLRGLTVTG